jgi:hypothetical protein
LKTHTLRTALMAAALVGVTASAVPAKMDLPATVDITKVTCSDLVGANALDRAATVMFYWGYAAAKANVTTFKTSLLRSSTEKLMTYCKTNQSHTIFGAMRALGVKAF